MREGKAVGDVRCADGTAAVKRNQCAVIGGCKLRKAQLELGQFDTN